MKEIWEYEKGREEEKRSRESLGRKEETVKHWKRKERGKGEKTKGKEMGKGKYGWRKKELRKKREIKEILKEKRQRK